MCIRDSSCSIHTVNRAERNIIEIKEFFLIGSVVFDLNAYRFEYTVDLNSVTALHRISDNPVSYTHLDVYKRQFIDHIITDRRTISIPLFSCLLIDISKTFRPCFMWLKNIR